MNAHADNSVYRILIIDDNVAIHEDFNKILRKTGSAEDEMLDREAILFNQKNQSAASACFCLDSAFQGQAGLEMVRRARAENQPYALAFVDGRMPPGWDGVDTIKRLWEESPDLQVVFCTAYADYSWREIRRALGDNDSLLILKKPFENIEVLQLIHTLTRKWALNRELQAKIGHLNAENESLIRLREALLASRKKSQAPRMASEAAGHLEGEFPANMSPEAGTPLNGLSDTSAPSSLESEVALNFIGAIAGSSLELDVVLNLILEITTRFLNASAGMVFLKDQVSGHLKLGTFLGMSEAFVNDFQAVPVRIGEGLTGTVAQMAQPIFIPADASHDPRIVPAVFRREGVNSFIGVPILSRGEVIGVMNILTHPPVQLSVQEVHICSAIGVQAGLAIQNAQLYSARQAQEDALRASENKLSSILANMTDVVWSASWPELQLNFISPSAESLYGRPLQEFYENPLLWQELTHPEDAHTIDEALIQVVETGVSERECRIIRPDGSVIWIRDKARMIVDASGRPTRLDGISTDITLWRRAEAAREKLQVQLMHAQKMEAVGILAGGVAHDFNNLLQAMLGNIELLGMSNTLDSQNQNRIQTVLKSLDRAARLVQQLLLFSRKAESRRVPLDVNQEVRKAARMLARTIPKMIALEFNLDAAIWRVLGDLVQMEQVLLNLVNNAVDAMPEGGRLRIETANVELDQEFVSRHSGSAAGRHVLLTVSDTGCGMDEATLGHVFDPFFTTKEVGKGTGLGLASVYGIVKAHGGYIQCCSEPEQGTVFRVYLPAA